MGNELNRTKRKNLKRKEREAEKKETTKNSRATRVISYLRSTGAISIFLSLGALMMLGPDGFPYCAALIYVAVIIGTADLFLETRASGRYAKIAILTGGMLLIVIISWRFVVVRLPLTIAAYSGDVDYVAGEVENGIQWSPKYTDLKLSISNTTAYDYSQLDLLIKPKDPVVAVALLPDSRPASIVRQTPITNFDLQLYRPSANRRFAIPTTCWASTGGFRLHADLLPSDSHITVVLAIADIDNGKTENSDYYMGPWKVGQDKFWYRWENHPVTDDLFWPRPTPKAVSITGSYVAFYRRKHVNETIGVLRPMNNAVSQFRPSKTK
jgi:hypothetical protein